MAEQAYAHGGVRALVALHDKHLREFAALWRREEAEGLPLPAESRADYGSMEGLLAHVLGAAGSYLIWICEQLELPRPELERDPDPQGFAARADAHLEAVLAAYGTALRTVTEAQADEPAYLSRWGTPYCIDAMLEHAVMHPIRHTRQLERWLQGE